MDKRFTLIVVFVLLVVPFAFMSGGGVTEKEGFHDFISRYYDLVSEGKKADASAFVVGNPGIDGKFFYWGPEWPPYDATSVEQVAVNSIGRGRRIVCARYIYPDNARRYEIGYLLDLWIPYEGHWKVLPLNLIPDGNVYAEIEEMNYMKSMFVSEREYIRSKVSNQLRAEAAHEERNRQLEIARGELVKRVAEEKLNDAVQE